MCYIHHGTLTILIKFDLGLDSGAYTFKQRAKIFDIHKVYKQKSLKNLSLEYFRIKFIYSEKATKFCKSSSYF